MFKYLKNFKHWYLLLFCGLFFVFAFLTYKMWPIANGEEFRYLRGKETLEHLTKGEFVELMVQPFPHYFIYNGYTALLTALNPSFYYEWFHLMNLLFSITIFIAAYFLALKLFKNTKWAIISLIFLILFPTFFGQLAINPIDVPFTSFYLFSLLAILHFGNKEKLNSFEIILLGLLFGVAQSLRQLGFGLYVLLFIFHLLKEGNLIRVIKKRSGEYLLIFLVSCVFMLITWPNFATNFFKSFAWYLSIGQNFYLWDFGLFFNGEILSNAARPWYYLPFLQLITSPVFIILFLIVSLAYFKKLKENKTYLFLVLALWLNYFLYFVLKPVLYDGTRHFLYLVPIIVLLAVLGLKLFLENSSNKWIKYSVLGFVIVNLILVTRATIENFPNHYVYFNEISTLFGNPYYLYESDYSSVLYKNAAEWIRDDYMPRNNLTSLKVYACDNGYAVDYYSHKKFAVVLDTEEADLIICDYRTLMGFKGGRNVTGELIYQIGFEGNPVTFIFDK